MSNWSLSRKAMHHDISEVNVPTTGSWQDVKFPAMEGFRKTLAHNYAALFKGQALPANTLEQFDAVYAFTANLRAAAATRTRFRFNFDYAMMPPMGRSLGPTVDMIPLAKITTGHAILALDEGRTDEALGDLKVNLIVADGIKRGPDLVSGLVAMGIVAISEGIVYHGLAEHKWSDAQLAEIEDILGRMDFLASFQFSMRVEAVGITTNIAFYKDYSQRKGTLPLDPRGAHSQFALAGRMVGPEFAASSGFLFCANGRD